jgi:hypothetical protein
MLPLGLIEQHQLRRRVHDRGGEREVQFFFRDRAPVLPIWHERQLLIVRWGCRPAESRALPGTGWTRLVTVESGRWAQWGAEEVEVPASLCLENGVWYKVRQGIRGVRVQDEKGAARAYLICEPASHYYQVMTRSAWMPVLIGERI